VVSHDRYFVSEIANKIWYIENEQIKEYPGTYDEYELWMAERGTVTNVTAPKSVAVQPSANSVPQTDVPRNTSDTERKERQQALKKATQRAEEAENQIGTLEVKKKQLEAELADPATYGTNGALQTRQAEYQRLSRDIDALQQQWEAAMLEAEELEGRLK
jgi:ATP-binding cassette, subfamily F, member 3